MKHNRAAARVLALVLALTLAFSLTSLPAWADLPTVGRVVVDGSTITVNPDPSVVTVNNGEVMVDANVVYKSEHSIAHEAVYATNDSRVTVTGDITVNGNEGISVFASGDKTTVTVNGDVKANLLKGTGVIASDGATVTAASDMATDE